MVLRTTPELLQLSAANFFRTVILEQLAARALVEGPNFAFGHKRAGTIETLRQLCGRASIELTILPPVVHEGRPVSSSRVRQALERGAVGEAATLMGHPYRLRGQVVAGQRRGRTLGFPTANLAQVPTLIPGNGVYAVRAYVADKSWPGAANIGPNPTFGEEERKVEIHLIGFSGDLLGQELALDFLDRLRDTRPFPSAGQLVEQLRHDVEQARKIVSSQ